MSTVRIAMHAVDVAVPHRARLGRELTNSSPMLLVQWYENALEAEEAARAALGAVINAEKRARLRDACFYGLI